MGISEEYRAMTDEIFEKIANFYKQGSGWQLRQVINVEIRLNKIIRASQWFLIHPPFLKPYRVRKLS